MDTDDGSRNYFMHDNFFVYGERVMKNGYGGHDNHHVGNIYAYVDEVLSVFPARSGDEDLFADNRSS